MKKQILVAVFSLLGVFVGTPSALEVTLLGPNQFFHTEAEPAVYADSFPGMVGTGRLVLKNGTQDGRHRIRSLVIKVNGREVLLPRDGTEQVYETDIPVGLAENNSISINLRSNPGGFVAIQITQEVQADAAVVIGTTGGIVQTPDDRFRIVVPDGSLSSAFLIRVEELRSPLFYKVYSVSSGRLSFTKPVQIIFKYDPMTLSAGTSEADLYVAILNDNFEIIEVLQDTNVDTVNKQITATTFHLSNVAMISPASGCCSGK